MPPTVQAGPTATTAPTSAVGALGRRFASVRAKATLGTTAVVAVALVAAGIAVLLSLRANLTDQADRQADSAAREVALDIASQVPEKASYAGLDLPDDEDHPVQVTDERGRLLAAGEELQRISGTGVSAVTPRKSPAPSPSASATAGSDDDDGGDDSADDDGHGDGDDPEIGQIGDVSGIPRAPRRSTARPATTASPPSM